MTDLDRVIDWSYENFVQHHDQPEILYFTFGKMVWKYLKAKDYENLSMQEQWNAILQVRDQLNNSNLLHSGSGRAKYFFPCWSLAN